jgi:hypothetical protein
MEWGCFFGVGTSLGWGFFYGKFVGRGLGARLSASSSSFSRVIIIFTHTLFRMNSLQWLNIICGQVIVEVLE